MTISSTTPGLLPTTMGPGSCMGLGVSGIPRIGAHHCRIDRGRDGSTSSHHCVPHLVLPELGTFVVAWMSVGGTGHRDNEMPCCRLKVESRGAHSKALSLARP